MIKIIYNEHDRSKDIVDELVYLTQIITIDKLDIYEEKKKLYKKVLDTKDKLIKIKMIDIVLTLIKNKKINYFNIIFYTFNDCIEKIYYYLELICKYNMSENIYENCECFDETFYNYHNHIKDKNKNNLITKSYLDCIEEWNDKSHNKINYYIISNIEKGYLYIIQEREFFRLNEKVFKIGCTKDYKKRLIQYPKGSILVFIIFNTNYKYVEKLWLNKLDNNNNLIKRTDIGKEYFEGNPMIIINELLKNIIKLNSYII